MRPLQARATPACLPRAHSAEAGSLGLPLPRAAAHTEAGLSSQSWPCPGGSQGHPGGGVGVGASDLSSLP